MSHASVHSKLSADHPGDRIAEGTSADQTSVADKTPSSPTIDCETVERDETTLRIETADITSLSEAEPSIFQLRRGDRVLLGVLLFVALLLAGVHWARLSGWGMQPVEIERHASRQYEYKIDINTATWVEWVQLNGIGRTMAERIVEERTRGGPFESIDELERVKGIGPKTLAKLRPWVTVSPTHTAQN